MRLTPVGSRLVLALAVVAASACSSDDWPRDVVRLQLDLPAETGGWTKTYWTHGPGVAPPPDCFVDVDAFTFTARQAGTSVLDRHDEDGWTDEKLLGGTSGEIVDDACRVTLLIEVTGAVGVGGLEGALDESCRVGRNDEFAQSAPQPCHTPSS